MAAPQPPTGPQSTRGSSRPGAMTMAMRAVQLPQTGPRVLRIGLIQGGKIVEERIVRNRETVSVGTSEKNHFILQAPNLPQRFEVFQLVGTDYILNFTEDMKGRVALPGGVQELDQLRQSGGARNAGRYWQVKLNDNSRGKLTIGDTTLLFQFVAPPPIQPRPQLPAAVVGGFVKSIDWLFTSFVVFTFMLFFGFIIYLESADWPIQDGITQVPDRYARLIFQEPAPPEPELPPEPVEDADEDVEGEEETGETEAAPTPSKTKGSGGDSGGAPNDGPPRPSVAQNVAASLQSLLFGAAGDDAGSAIDALTSGGVLTSTDELLAQTAGGVGAATSGGATLRTQGGGSGGSGESGALGSLASSGAGNQQAGTGGVEERGPTIRGNLRLTGGSEIGGQGFFDQSKVVALIRRRQSAIKRCYENRLRQNPTLNGKVSVSFTIEQSGRVSGARAAENTTGDAQLEACVVGVIERLRWTPGPEDGSVQYSFPFVFSPQT